MKLLLCVIAIAVQTGTTAASECEAHDACGDGMYCAVDNKCWNCFFCRFMKNSDSITGNCDDAGCDAPGNDDADNGDDGSNDDGEAAAGESDDETTTTAAATTTTTTTTTTVATAAATTAAPTTTKKAKAELFYCDPQDASTTCECPASLGCGKLGSCRQAFASNPDKLICDTCSDGFVETTTAKTKRCVKSFVCQAGKIVTPPKYAGESCKCKDKNCNWCVTTAAKETCKTCRNSKYLFDAACHDTCDIEGEEGLVTMGTGAYKRRCFADPFTCIKGYFHNPTNGDRITKPYGCKCPNKAGTKFEPNCHTCDFKAGGHGECAICKGRKFFHNNECLDSCQGTGLVGYLPSGKGGVCRESFSCLDGVDQSDGESNCICPKKLAFCKSCNYGEAGAVCTECEGKRPYLHEGTCRKACPKNNPAKQDETNGKQCS